MPIKMELLLREFAKRYISWGAFNLRTMRRHGSSRTRLRRVPSWRRWSVGTAPRHLFA
jgi:hypothetical protein